MGSSPPDTGDYHTFTHGPQPTPAQMAVKRRLAISDEMMAKMETIADLVDSSCPPGYFLWGTERSSGSRMTYFIYIPTDPRGIYWLDG